MRICDAFDYTVLVYHFTNKNDRLMAVIFIVYGR